MAVTRCAIFYATNSKHLRVTLLPDDDSELAQLTAPPGVSILLVPVVPTATGVGCPDDEACRALIAQATGTQPLDADADRCVVLNGFNRVINRIKADPEIDAPPRGPDGTPALTHRLVLHRLADIGDRWANNRFERRHIFVERVTGRIASETWLPLGEEPTAPDGQYAAHARDFNINDILARRKSDV